MKLDAVAALGARLSRLSDRSEAGRTASEGVVEAFGAGAVIVWLPTDAALCRGSEIHAAGHLISASTTGEMASALSAGAIDKWLVARGAAVSSVTSVHTDGRPAGSLVAGWRSAPPNRTRVDLFLALVADQVGAVLTRERLAAERDEAEAGRQSALDELRATHDGLRQSLADRMHLSQRGSALLDVARRLSSETDAEAIYRIALETVERTVEGACAVVANCEAGRSFAIRAVGPRATGLQHLETASGGAAAGWGAEVLEGGCATSVLLDARYSFDAALLENGFTAVTAIPVAIGGAPCPVLLLAWRDARECTPEDLWFLENLSALMSLALRTTQVRSDLRQTLLSLREAEQEVRRAQRLRAIGDLASGIAHQFNNSLTTILGLSDWLLFALPPNATGRSELVSIRAAATETADLVKRLRAFTRMTAAEPWTVIDPVATLHQIPELIRPRLEEESRRRGVAFDLVMELGQVPLVRFVPSELSELLLHLVTNALEAMPAGGRVTLRSKESAGRVRLSVSDEGGGIPAGSVAQLFEPFFTTKGGDNLGLGLCACRGMAERYGGSIEVASEPGRGATFTLVLPVPEAIPEAATPVAVQQGEPTGDHGDQAQVLVVDDQEDVREALAEMVAALGHHVETAASGETAEALLKQRAFDVLLTDLGMPGLDGRELARRAALLTPGIRIVLLTGWSGETEEAKPPGVSLVLPKPVTMKTLRSVLAAVPAGVAAA